jgi:glycosyltransferase involved in cell wall biosynthesis
LQGEDTFLDALPETHRAVCWQTLAERAAEVDLFIAPSRYFGDLMRERLGLPASRVRVVHNGINLEGYGEAPAPEGATGSTQRTAPALGFLARMCKEKGLDTLVEAFILLKQGGRAGNLKLRVGGSCGPSDEPFVKTLRQRLAAAGCIGETGFLPNLSRSEKLDFLRSLTVFSVPALYGEAFGLYVIEALAAGVPVVQPRTAAFPELIAVTGGGALCEPGDPQALADAIEQLLLNPKQARALGEAGRRAVFEKFSAEAMADEMVRAFATLVKPEIAVANRKSQI